MSNLAAWLLEQIAEDERLARGAVDPDRPGVDWEWVSSTTDVPVPPGAESNAIDEGDLSLRTVETFPTAAVGPLPAFAIHRVEEGLPGALRHIAVWDPSRVLAECDAKRRIMREHRAWSTASCAVCSYNYAMVDPSRVQTDCPTLRLLALPYADRPGYQPEWCP